MKAFAELLDRLSYTPSRNAKLRLMTDYFRATPDPDRGWALAALTDGLPVSIPFRRTIMEIIAPRLDAELFRLSRDYVGDTAETVALVWPEPQAVDERERAPAPRLGEVIDTLALIGRDRLAPQLVQWLDGLDATGRWALLKLLAGAPRVGVSRRLAKTAVAALGPVEVDVVEEVWHGLAPPYAPLFQWLAGHAPKPDVAGAPVFRPLMLSHALEESDLAALDVGDYSVEWKWDGIRVQIVCSSSETRLYTRTGDDISGAFPDIVEPWQADGVFDGELLVVRGGEVAPFADLQKRLNRKAVTRLMLAEAPAHVRLYDVLVLGDEDLRALPFDERRTRLEAWAATARPGPFDLSPLVPVADRDELSRIWREVRGNAIEGLMLKRRASPYLAGRPKGHWFKWKRAALTIDCVLMYAQRGSGKRSSYFSDYTFGCWSTPADASEPELLPVGKAYFGFTDEELRDIDRFVRNNTIERFGPVTRVRPGLVLEIAFDAVQRSPRHKSGVAMRFPRIHRIRWDKPAAEADRLETLVGMIGA